MPKINQNAIVDVNGHTVITTNTKCFVYQGKRLIGSSGCVRSKDFDFDTLYALAMHKSGSKIEII